MDKLNFRNKEISYAYGWADDETFGFDFGDGEFVDSDNMEYFIRFEYNQTHNEWVIEIWWECSYANINELDKSIADAYITEQEIEEIKDFAKKFMGALNYVELPKDCNFDTKFDTYIIAFCPDTDSWFVTNERFFYYEYGKEFQTMEEGIEYFKKNPKKFYDKEIRMGVYRPPFSENAVWLDNTKELIPI